MHIEIHIFPDSFRIDPIGWANEMHKLNTRIWDHIMKATVDSKSYANGKSTLLAEDGSGMILATIDIRRE